MYLNNTFYLFIFHTEINYSAAVLFVDFKQSLVSWVVWLCILLTFSKKEKYNNISQKQYNE